MYSRNKFNVADLSKFLNAENVLQSKFSLRTTAGEESGNIKVLSSAPIKKGASQTAASAKTTTLFAI
jgi:hypothetical protein